MSLLSLYSARKNERSRWNTLFSVTCQPEFLFHAFIDANKLDWASSTLPLIKDVGSMCEGDRLRLTYDKVLMLLEICLSRKNVILVCQIWRFNKSIELELVDFKARETDVIVDASVLIL